MQQQPLLHQTPPSPLNNFKIQQCPTHYPMHALCCTKENGCPHSTLHAVSFIYSGHPIPAGNFSPTPPPPPCSPYPGTAGRACFLQHNVYLNLGFVFDCWQTKNPIYLFLSSKIWMYGTCSININSLTPFFVTHNSRFLSSKRSTMLHCVSGSSVWYL